MIFVKDHIVNIFDFVSHPVSVTTLQLCVITRRQPQTTHKHLGVVMFQ